MFVPLVRSTEFSWLGEGLWSEFPSHLERARILAPIPENKLHFTCRLIWFHVLRGDFGAAESVQLQAELLLCQFDVPYERPRLEDPIGQLLFANGDLAAAEIRLPRSLELANQVRDRRSTFACNKYPGEPSCARTHAARVGSFPTSPHPN